MKSSKIIYKTYAVNTSLEDLPEGLAKTVKTVDPMVLTILATVNETMNAVNIPWQDIAVNIGMIVSGNAYPKHYTQKVITELRTKNRVSPLSFINSNAGAAISICCTTYKFQGPTINLTISGKKSEKLGEIIINQWLSNGDAEYVFYITADFNEGGACAVSNKLIGPYLF
jgi:hypothetical protein